MNTLRGNLRGRRGAALVEAALLFPLCIILIMGLLSYAARLSEEVSRQAQQNIAKREALLEQGSIKRGEADWIRIAQWGLEKLDGNGQAPERKQPNINAREAGKGNDIKP